MESETVETEPFGERLRRLRKERGYSQITLAEQSGVTDAWISQIEMGRAMPSAELINQFAQVLKVPVRELLQDEEEAMEIISRQKLIGVLLETNQPDVAEEIIAGLQGHPELSDVDSMKLIVDLAQCRFQQRRYAEALESLGPLILKLESDNYHDAYLMATIRNLMGRLYFATQDFTDALYNFRKAYDYTHRFAIFDSLAAKIAYNVGLTFRRIGNSKDSIFYLELAHDFFQKNNKVQELANTIYAQGIAYKSIKDYSRASECFDQAKSLFQSLDLISWASKVQVTLASSVTLDTDPELALTQLNECISLLQQDNDVLALILTYSKLASVQLRMNSFEEAHSSLTTAYRLVVENSFYHAAETGECYKVFAQYHYLSRNFADSIEYASKGAELFDRIGLIRDQVDCLQTAVDAHEEIGDLKQALCLERKCNQRLIQLTERSGVL